MTAVSGALIGGRYRLLELIGQGGMGRVWRGQDTTLGRDVAVKEVLLPPGVGERERDELVQRVLREARAAARLNHPGIVTVHDVVEYEGAPVIVMEYVTGRSLAAALARGGALPVERVAELGVAMVKALQRAHAAGIVHRDLKPDNVLLTDDRVVITDFGIAHMADATTALTRTGAVIGTPAFMAPEQLEGRPPTPANDLWSLGATLYAAVEGEAPFSGTTFGALCVAVVTKEPRPPVRAGVLAPVLAALLAKDPAHRATAEQVLAALETVARTGVLPGGLPVGPVPVPTALDAGPVPGGAVHGGVAAGGAGAAEPFRTGRVQVGPVASDVQPDPVGQAGVPGQPGGYGQSGGVGQPGGFGQSGGLGQPTAPAADAVNAPPAVPPRAGAYPVPSYPVTSPLAPVPGTPGPGASVPAARSGPTAVGAAVVRFLGCVGLIWAIGALLPWNNLGDVPESYFFIALMVTAVLALLHALPRPRWHPAAVWAATVTADVGLFFLTKAVLLAWLGARTIGFGELPWQIVVNMLILGTGAWLLWLVVPGSRQRS
ncbi:protein kinase [Kitasatospora sp. A2-31]|uniref:serine/threonine-protein kinase n=1 Tax=Kitasatospora sp. A2-31 TaxID=2916414 RepID=UPI0027E2CFDC|nr:protein kinase [Kitasatospora sp. A2-31]